MDRVPQELKGFAKVELQPGEEKEVSIRLNRRSLAYYDVRAHDFLLESGPVEIRVGSSSADIRLTTTCQVIADRLPPVMFDLNSTRADLLAHPIAARVAGPFFNALGSLFAKNPVKDPITNQEENPFALMMEEMEANLPLRALIQLSMGLIQEPVLQDLVDRCNAAVSDHPKG
jgi:beta-glucosidase